MFLDVPPPNLKPPSGPVFDAAEDWIPKDNRVILLSIDAIAREKFKREMPATLSALRTLAKSNEVFGFERYHTMGVNTRVNMLPLMTGARSRGAYFSNWLEHAWLYHVAEDAGYGTAVAGDFCTGMIGNPFTNNGNALLNWVSQTTGRYPSSNVFPVKVQCKHLYQELHQKYDLSNQCTMTGKEVAVSSLSISIYIYMYVCIHIRSCCLICWFHFLYLFLARCVFFRSGRQL